MSRWKCVRAPGARRRRWAAGAFARWAPALLVILAAGGACRKAGDAAAQADHGSVKRYTLRAEVVSLPASPGGDLMLRHEAIPDFTDETGKVVGMASMVMPFPVAPRVSVEGLAVGAPIEVELAVDWKEGLYQLERITKLPQGTVLHLGEGGHGGETAKKGEGSR